ncbi:MAG: hypothetical protein AAFU67_04625 [Bacteroidota bacterium]
MEFNDGAIQLGSTYEYRVVAIDDANLEAPSKTVTATRIDDGERAAFLILVYFKVAV